MKQLIAALALTFAAAGAMAASHAAAAPAKNDQQNKMTVCNKEAGDKKGDERKAFMKECLSADKATAASPACEKSADDKKLAGAARTSHIKKCMADAKPEAKKG